MLSSREAEGKLLASLDAKMSLNHRIIAYNIGMAKCIGSKLLHGISPADSAQALKNAAELESKGVDLYRLARYAYHKFSKAQDKVQQDALVVIEAQRQDVIAKDINARLESCIRQAIS